MSWQNTQNTRLGQIPCLALYLKEILKCNINSAYKQLLSQLKAKVHNKINKLILVRLTS